MSENWPRKSIEIRFRKSTSPIRTQWIATMTPKIQTNPSLPRIQDSGTTIEASFSRRANFWTTSIRDLWSLKADYGTRYRRELREKEVLKIETRTGRDSTQVRIWSWRIITLIPGSKYHARKNSLLTRSAEHWLLMPWTVESRIYWESTNQTRSRVTRLYTDQHWSRKWVSQQKCPIEKSQEIRPTRMQMCQLTIIPMSEALT